MGYQELAVTRFDLYLGPSEFKFLPEDLSWSPGVKVKVKVNFTLEQAMKTQRWS